MADNPTLKTRSDRDRVSGQPHEIAYLRSQIKEMAPERSDDEINAAIAAARGAAQPSESRQEILMLVKSKLNL